MAYKSKKVVKVKRRGIIIINKRDLAEAVIAATVVSAKVNAVG